MLFSFLNVRAWKYKHCLSQISTSSSLLLLIHKSGAWAKRWLMWCWASFLLMSRVLWNCALTLFFVFFCFWHTEVAALIVLISHVDQINDVFFGQQGVLKGLYGTYQLYLKLSLLYRYSGFLTHWYAGLQKGALIILRSTILPSYIQNLEKRLRGHVYCEFIMLSFQFSGTFSGKHFY